MTGLQLAMYEGWTVTVAPDENGLGMFATVSVRRGDAYAETKVSHELIRFALDEVIMHLLESGGRKV